MFDFVNTVEGSKFYQRRDVKTSEKAEAFAGRKKNLIERSKLVSLPENKRRSASLPDGDGMNSKNRIPLSASNPIHKEQ